VKDKKKIKDKKVFGGYLAKGFKRSFKTKCILKIIINLRRIFYLKGNLKNKSKNLVN